MEHRTLLARLFFLYVTALGNCLRVPAYIPKDIFIRH
jgi:hypothetical protein